MKRIYLTQRVERIESIGERRDALSQEWAALAEACGFLPIPLPNRLPTVRRLLEDPVLHVLAVTADIVPRLSRL